jgi:hypothetical protein
MAQFVLGAIVWIATCLIASHAWGQEAPPRRVAEQAPAPLPVPQVIQSGPPLAAYPLELLSLLSPQGGPVTLIPSLAVSEEYNDNLRLINENRQSDFITAFSPAIMLAVNRPTLRLIAGYSFSAELFAKESDLNNAFSRHNFILSGVYVGTRGLTFTVSDSFALSRDTNQVPSQGFATGRQTTGQQQVGVSNIFTPGVTWQMTPGTSLSFGATYGLQRFEGEGAGVGSDTYGFSSTLGHVLTPRLTGTIGYGFTYLDFLGQQDNSRTHSPTLGVSYALTPTLIGSVVGGVAVSQTRNETLLSPVVSAGLAQTLQFGSATLQYTRGVSVAGGLGGTTDNQTIAGALALTTWLRDLIVVFSPTYSMAESVSSRQTDRVDAQALTLNLKASYQIARAVSVFGGYTFFQQHTGGSSATQFDVDQNRVMLGVQFGYPINFN